LYYSFLNNISNNLFANVNDLYLNLLKQYGLNTQTSSTKSDGLFGLAKNSNIYDIQLNKEFDDQMLGVMDNAIGGMYVLREEQGNLMEYVKDAKCLVSMCADKSTGTRNNKDKNNNWKEGFVAVVVVKDNVVVSDPLYVALQCNSDEEIDKSNVFFENYSVDSDNINVYLEMGNQSNLQIKRYLVYPKYMNYYSSPYSENKIADEFNVTGDFSDNKSFCDSTEVDPVYVEYEIAGMYKSLYVFDPCGQYSTKPSGKFSFERIDGENIILKKEGYFNPICSAYVNIGNKSFLLKDYSTMSIPFSSVKDGKINLQYDNWIKNGTKLYDNIEKTQETSPDSLYETYNFKLKQIDSICKGVSSEVNIGGKNLENTFEYVGYEKISNNLVLIKIKATVKNTGTNEININGAVKNYSFGKTGTYNLNVSYDIFKQQITNISESKISFVKNLIHTILGIDTAFAVSNMPYPLPTIYDPIDKITCYKCDESKGECSSYIKNLRGNDLLSSIYNLLAMAPPIGGIDNDDKDDPCYPDYSKKSDCEDNCSKKVTYPKPSVSMTVITSPPSKDSCWLYASKDKKCYKPTYS
jgi:hypothetical protein